MPIVWEVAATIRVSVGVAVGGDMDAVGGVVVVLVEVGERGIFGGWWLLVVGSVGESGGGD